MLTKLDTSGYTKKTIWCGPAAIATHTGVSVKQATELLCSVMQGTSYEDLDAVLDEHMTVAFGAVGYRMVPIREFHERYADLPYGPSIKRFMQERPVMEKASQLLLNVGQHYTSAHLGYMSDNWTMGPVPVEKFPQIKRRVKQLWRIEKKEY